MNLIKTFEDRMNSVFGAGATGVTSPFSLRKLAKRAAKEMEAETFDIDGIATAPALYTILVSEQDDANIRSLYLRLIQEISSFIEAKAQSKSYVFTGKPLIRFMVDPGLKSGKFAVFAENVDAFTLSRLRAEEDAFFQGSLGLGGAASEQLENSKSSEPVNMDVHVSAGAAQPAQAFATPVRDVASPDDSMGARPLPSIDADAAQDKGLAQTPAQTPFTDASASAVNASAGSVDRAVAAGVDTPSAHASEAADPFASPEPSAIPSAKPKAKPTPRAAKHRSAHAAMAASAAGAGIGAGINAAAAAGASARAAQDAYAADMPFVPAGPKQNEIPAAAPASFYRRGVVPIPDETSAGDFAPLVGNQNFDPSRGLDVLPGDYAEMAGASYANAPYANESFAPQVVARNNSPHVPLVNLRPSARDAYSTETKRGGHPASNAQKGYAQCLLIDRQTGETYSVEAPSAIIGRERASAQVVLHDPNVSRNHAELVFDGQVWSIHDLGSTNGTQVNNLMVDASVLHDGDVITVALTNLEFREM